jgi:hypothetical protein
MQNGVPVIHPIHTRESLMVTYERYMQDPTLGEAQFWHQYMNVCKAPSTQKIKEEWFFKLQSPGWPVAKRRVLAIDSAEKDFQRIGIGDYMVALFGEFDDNGRLCIVHGIRSNSLTRDAFQRQIISWCKAVDWWPTYVVKEKFGTDTFLTDMDRCFLQQSRPVFCVTESRGGNKDVVNVKKYDWIIASLQAPMERGDVVWGSNCPPSIMARALYEITNLGQTAYDDVADTLALFFTAKVRIKKVDKGPDKGFAWDPPGMSNYGPDKLDPRTLENIEKGTTIVDVHNPALARAKEDSRVKEAFFGLGGADNAQWNPKDVERPSFNVGSYE